LITEASLDLLARHQNAPNAKLVKSIAICGHSTAWKIPDQIFLVVLSAGSEQIL
jgi:hypothetical protein